MGKTRKTVKETASTRRTGTRTTRGENQEGDDIIEREKKQKK